MDRRQDTLREAASMGDEDTVQALLAAGVDPNAQHAMNGWTALHWAAKRDHARTVRLLLEHGALPEVATKDGKTAADLAGPNSRPVLGADAAPATATGAGKGEGEGEGEGEETFVPSYLKHPAFFYAAARGSGPAADGAVAAAASTVEQALPGGAAAAAKPAAARRPQPRPATQQNPPARPTKHAPGLVVEVRRLEGNDCIKFAGVAERTTLVDVCGAAGLDTSEALRVFADAGAEYLLVPSQTCAETWAALGRAGSGRVLFLWVRQDLGTS